MDLYIELRREVPVKPTLRCQLFVFPCIPRPYTFLTLMIKRIRKACMSVFRLREKKLKSLSFLNDAHTETMGRHSD